MLYSIKIFVLASTISMGQVPEERGTLSHTFFIHNRGTESIRLANSYTSCHCTSAHFDSKRLVAPGDSIPVRIDFNLQGKGGEFLESANVQIVSKTDTIHQNLYLEGEVIPSSESLAKAYPVKVGKLRLSTTSLDFGQMKRGETKTLTIAVQGREPERVTLKADNAVGWGLQNLKRTITVNGTKVNVSLKVLVIDSASGSQSLTTKRRLASGTKNFTITNSGSSPLVLHRIYTPKGNILNKDTNIAPGKSLDLTIPQSVILSDDDTQITIISNDPSTSRYVVRLQK